MEEEKNYQNEILLSYLESFAEKEGPIFKTSQDIQDDLAELTDIDIDTISQTMVDEEYRLTLDESMKLAWRIK